MCPPDDARLLRALAESSVDVTCVFDETRRASYYSPSTRTVLGYAPAEMLAMTRAPIHEADRPEVERHVAAMFAGERRTMQFRMRHAGGHWIWLEATGGPLFDAHGQRLGICTTARDITDRLRTEHARRESEARMRMLLERVRYGVGRVSDDGIVTDANDVLTAMLAQSPSAGDRVARLPTPVMQAVRTQARVGAGDVLAPEWIDAQWPVLGGGQRTVRVAARARDDELSAVGIADGGYELVVEDVTDRLHMDELRQRTDRLAGLGRMLAGAAHELNNPLAAVCGFAQLLLRGSLDGEDRQAAETIDHEARRAAVIVQDLLTFSRRASAAERRRVDLGDIVRYIAQSRRYALATSGVSLSVELFGGALDVLADPTQLEQVVLNLVGNAAESFDDPDALLAQSREPRIVLRTLHLEGLAVLEVVDNGPGIAEDVLPNIWNPFFTTKSEREGTGLGLAVVHRLVADHGGAVDVERVAEGGTRFRVALPLAPDDEPGTRSPVGRAGDVPTALDILVVEPDLAAAGFLTRLLGVRGHAVLHARTDAQARRLATQTGCDVIVMDVELAVGGVLRDLRAMPSCRHARVVVTTPGDVSEASARVATEVPATPGDGSGPVVTLARPYEVGELRRAVEGS